MSTFDTLTQAQAEALASTGIRIKQFLQETSDGAAGPNRPKRYTSDEIDAALAALVVELTSAGYAPPAGPPVDTPMSLVANDGTPSGTAQVEVDEAEELGYKIRIMTTP